MADQRDGGIAWTDESWNPVRGCSRVSEGCRNCYAERIAERFCDGPGEHYTEGDDGAMFKAAPQPFHTFAERGKGWTRKVALLPEMLVEPLRWRKPSRVFVCSTSDLFHDALPDSAIDEVLAVMLLAHRHTFMVLTKRAARMREYFAAPGLYGRVLRVVENLRRALHLTANVGVSDPGRRLPPWIWLGVSVEDQQRADERIPHLLATPAAVRWVSYEPALGPVDFTPWFGRRVSVPDGDYGNAYCSRCGIGWNDPDDDHECPPGFGPRPNWLVVGGESGPGARPFDLAWARSTIRQCREAGVACFVKQLGTWIDCDTTAPDLNEHFRGKASRYLLADERTFIPAWLGERAGLPPEDAEPVAFGLRDRKGGDPAEWPPALRVREFPEVRRA